MEDGSWDGADGYAVGLKKKHSKTGEESRFQGTVLGKDPEPHRIVIEGGAESINAWATQMRSRERSQVAPTIKGNGNIDRSTQQTETPGQMHQTQANTPAISSTTSLSPVPDTDAMET